MTIVGIILLGLLIGSVYLILVNRHDEKIAQIGVKILIIAIVTSFTLIIFQIISPLPSDSKTVDILILRNKKVVNIKDFSEKLLKVGSLHKNGYGLLHNVSLFSPKNKGIKINPDVISIDLLEMSFWTWLSKRYHLHWDVDIEYFEGISGGQGNINKSADAEKNPKKLSSDDISGYLQDSIFLVPKGHLWGLSLPSGSTLNIIERDKHRRAFQIKNKFIDFEIDIHKVGGSGLLFTTLGENIRKTLPSPDSWYSDNFKVKFECKYSKWFRGSLNTKKQKKWVNEIMNDFYNDFDLSLVKPDLEKAYSSNN